MCIYRFIMYIHTYIHTYIYTYIYNTYLHTYIGAQHAGQAHSNRGPGLSHPPQDSRCARVRVRVRVRAYTLNPRNLSFCARHCTRVRACVRACVRARAYATGGMIAKRGGVGGLGCFKTPARHGTPVRALICMPLYVCPYMCALTCVPLYVPLCGGLGCFKTPARHGTPVCALICVPWYRICACVRACVRFFLIFFIHVHRD